MTTQAIVFSVAGGFIWGIFLGILNFHWTYTASKKALDKGVKPMINPLKMLIVPAGLIIPALIPNIRMYALLATFGGFAVGFALWWLWFKTHHTSGGKDA